MLNLIFFILFFIASFFPTSDGSHLFVKNKDSVQYSDRDMRELLKAYEKIPFSIRSQIFSSGNKQNFQNEINKCNLNPFPPGRRQMLQFNEYLRVGDFLKSKYAKLSLLQNGNLVLTHNTGRVLWSSNSSSSHPDRLEITNLGLTLFNDDNSTYWCAQASVQVPKTAVLTLHDNCDLSLFAMAPFTIELWSTNSGECLDVHIIPHSHDDVGWLLSPERYYDGCHHRDGGVQSIISSVVEALSNDPKRRFVQVEQYFFNRWWVRQSEQTKQKVRDIVNKKQLVFIGGGWTMHDEACVHQESGISNMARGAQFIRQEFGNFTNVTIGWQIDPFGHASSTPRLMAQMGFNGLFFWRTDYQHREQMKNMKMFETLWDSSDSLGNSVLMFTSIMPDSYCMGCNNNLCPSSFCCMDCEENLPPRWASMFENTLLKSRPRTNIKNLLNIFRINSEKSFSVKDIGDNAMKMYKDYAKYFRTSNILIPWGCDFEHLNASVSFDFFDKIMAFVNKKYKNANLFYSTPQEYLDNVQNEGYAWPINYHDYFLDSDDEHSYWSGYPSSRVEYKHWERNLMNIRSASDILFSSLKPDTKFPDHWLKLDTMKQAIGVAQHHDSITGTERLSVRNEYQKILTNGMTNANSAMSDMLNRITGLQNPKPCVLSNLSYCLSTEQLKSGRPVSVILYNPLKWIMRDQIVTIPIPVNTISLSFYRNDNKPINLSGQVQDTWAMTKTVDPPSPHVAPMPFELIISLSMAPLNVTTFIINPNKYGMIIPYVPSRSVPQNSNFNLSNDEISTVINSDTGLITYDGITSGISMQVRLDYAWYTPWTEGGQNSGAYILRTAPSNAKPNLFKMRRISSFVDGPICKEVRQLVDNDNNIHQTLRLCKKDKFLTLIYGIGEITTGDNGREVIMMIRTPLQSRGAFYTDSQGLETQKRVRGKRPNYVYNVTEEVAANFFPSNQWIFIRNEEEDDPVTLSLVGDYSRSVSSMEDGELEVLAMRRLTQDDGRGVAQALDESIRVISSNLLIIERQETANEMRRISSVFLTHPPLVFYSTQREKVDSAPKSLYLGENNMEVLPNNVLLHSREMLNEDTILVRLQHLFGVNESKTFSVSVNIDLKQIMPHDSSLGDAVILSVDEVDINGVTKLDEINTGRNVYSACGADGVFKGPTQFKPSLRGHTVELRPMEIRTFLIKCQWE